MDERNDDVPTEKDNQITANISANILTLRRRLKLTQKGFIDTHLLDDKGNPLVSVSTLSNIENGIQTNVTHLVISIARHLGVDSAIFSMDPDSFAKNIDLFFRSLMKNGNGDQVGLLFPARKSNVETLVQTISDYLMDAIISGELKPGDKLPSDRSLSATYGVARTSVREALKALSTLGLIHILPGQGTFVASEPTDFFLMPLSWTFLIGQNNTNHIVDVRNVLEVESARLAATQADSTSLQELTELYDRMAVAYERADFGSFLNLDLDFHLAIAKCSGNPIIHSLLHTSRKLLAYISKSGMVTVEHLRDIYSEHSAIHSAIIQRDEARASLEMSKHLTSARKRYRM